MAQCAGHAEHGAYCLCGITMPAVRPCNPIAKSDLIAIMTQTDPANQLAPLCVRQSNEEMGQQIVARPINEALRILSGQWPGSAGLFGQAPSLIKANISCRSSGQQGLSNKRALRMNIASTPFTSPTGSQLTVECGN